MFKALNGLLCADVPLRNYSLTPPVDATDRQLQTIKTTMVMVSSSLCLHYEQSWSLWLLFCDIE